MPSSSAKCALFNKHMIRVMCRKAGGFWSSSRYVTTKRILADNGIQITDCIVDTRGRSETLPGSVTSLNSWRRLRLNCRYSDTDPLLYDSLDPSQIALARSGLLFPSNSSSNSGQLDKDDLLLARTALEIGAFHSLKVKDVPAFTRYEALVAGYYRDLR